MPLEHRGVITGMQAIREEREEYYAYNFILLFILEMLKSIIYSWIFQQPFFVITQTVLLSYKAVWESKCTKSGTKLHYYVHRESLESGSVYLHGPLNSTEIHSIHLHNLQTAQTRKWSALYYNWNTLQELRSPTHTHSSAAAMMHFSLWFWCFVLFFCTKNTSI